MQLNGLWIMAFASPEVYGSGVAVLSNGKLFGGETGFYYIGTYQTDGKTAKARVMVRNFDPKIASGFGIPGDYEMDVSLIIQDENNMKGTAVVTKYPQHSIGVRLTKKANL